MKALIGGLLMAAGILIGGASGLCTAAFFVMGLASGSPGEIASMLPLVAVVGGLPFGTGVALFLGGRALIRSARRDREDPAGPD